LERLEKIVWPFALTKFNALNSSVYRYCTPSRHIAAATTTTWVWFFGFLDDSRQIYGNGFAWFSLAGTHSVLETATSSLTEYGAAITATTGGIIVIAASSRHRISHHARFRTRHARPLRRHNRSRFSRNSPDSPKFAMRIRVASIPCIKQA
jgi:hypothetical protein